MVLLDKTVDPEPIAVAKLRSAEAGFALNPIIVLSEPVVLF